MATVHVSTRPLIAKSTPYPPGIGNAATALRNAKRPADPQMASALEAMAAAATNLQNSTNDLHSTLRNNPPQVQQILVTDQAGRVIAAIGDFEYQGVVTPNYFSELHVGDPLNTGNPAQALFNAVGNRVTIGQNGIVEVLDPFGNDAAWIGAQADTLPVTGAVNNGAGLIRLTVTAHTLATGDVVPVQNVGGVPNATGLFTVTNVDANHVDLQNSVFVGTYTSGGTINRLLHITGAANNGSGLIRVTITAHGYVTGDEVNIVSVGGVPAATGQWIITVVTANTFDLQSSAFAGAYTSGGTCLRYFAGMLAQTFAVGPSFANYKLRAFADGSLKIQGATFALNLNGITTTVGNTNIGTVGIVGLEVQDNGTLDAMVATPDFLALFRTDPLNTLPAIALARNANAGILKVYDGSGAGGIDGHGLQCAADGSNGNITLQNLLTANGNINTLGVYQRNGVNGLSVTRSFGTSLTVNSVANGVVGTPGAGQANATQVTGVTLNLTSNTWSGGIIVI